jgi:hypothetical protein
LPGDRIALFDPFVTLDDAWQVVSGGWQHDGDDALHTLSTSAAQLLVRTDLTLDDVVIEARGRATEADLGEGLDNFGALSWANSSSGQMCDALGDNEVELLALHDLVGNAAGNAIAQAGLAAPIALQMPFVLRASNVGGLVSCALEGPTGSAQVQAPATQSLTGRHVALRSNRFAMTVTSVVVYEVGP